MLRHLLALIWKRKTRHLLLTLELALAFAVVFAVCAFALRQAQLWRLPLGFAFERVWAVQLQVPDFAELTRDPTLVEQFKRLLQAQPEVAAAALVGFAPYTNSSNTNRFATEDGARSADGNVLSASDELVETLGLRIVEGRGFSAADGGAGTTPVLVDRRLAAALFPGRSAVGQRFTSGAPDAPSRRVYRITGVIEAYRDHGEFMNPVNFVLTRYDSASGLDIPTQLVVLLRPGTPRAYEARLNALLKQMRGEWGYRIAPLADLRADSLRMVLLPFTVVAVVAAFLLLMVAFGLFGVLWQSTTQRIPEIGLRRAVGAPAARIHRQILAEQMLLSTLGMALALVPLMQLPITGAFGEELNGTVFTLAALLAALAIYAVSALCALYPAWRASRLDPAAALRHE